MASDRVFQGLRIRSIRRGSPAYKAGLRKADLILSVNGEKVFNDLEFGFFCALPQSNIQAVRRNAFIVRNLKRPSGQSHGIIFHDTPIKRCGNRCIFCFIDQMPKGLRQSLYIKDEDYRYSFTNGNYITLSGASPSQLERIATLGLSPLYISVHAASQSIRSKMLGNSNAYDIVRQLRFLERNNIRFHTQIVVCPGINDGCVLQKTIQTLATLKSGLLSIAVVPVGLTRYRKIPLVPVGQLEALTICRQVDILSDRYKNALGRRCIFCADELFIKAQLPIPAEKYYEGYPQIENGVGLVALLLKEWQETKRRLLSCKPTMPLPAFKQSRKHCLIVTSKSAFAFISKIGREINELFSLPLVDITSVRNEFFGESVSVAGLMTARDAMKTIKNLEGHYQCIFLPAVMFNSHGYTLDGYSRQRMEKMLRTKIKTISSIKEIIDYVARQKT
jgi:putative radical SAM enzyme (TIGR03279 family)